MLDIHAHLYWKSFDADREAVIRRAREAGVEKIICVAATAEESKLAVALARQYDLKASVGIHPQWFNELGIKNQELGIIHNSQFIIPSKIEKEIEKNISKLREVATDPKVVAIGECGLEYFSHDPAVTISAEQKERQKKGFLMQIDLAQELGLPLIVHCRPARSSYANSVAGGDAYEDMLEILTNYLQPTTCNKNQGLIQNKSELSVVGRGLSVVLHCYMGDTAVTRKFLELPNVYFSFTGNITYPTRKEARGTKYDLGEVVKSIPLERIFTETDCPFLAPLPVRGKRNEPAFVRHTFAKVAELQAIPSEVLEKTLLDNYIRVFKK